MRQGSTSLIPALGRSAPRDGPRRERLDGGEASLIRSQKIGCQITVKYSIDLFQHTADSVRSCHLMDGRKLSWHEEPGPIRYPYPGSFDSLALYKQVLSFGGELVFNEPGPNAPGFREGAVNPAQGMQDGSYDRAVSLRVEGVLKLGSSHRRRFLWAG